MSIKSGAEIVRLHRDYEKKISEVEGVIATLQGYDYAKGVLDEQLNKLKLELQRLEDTRFQALDPVIIAKSLLGGR